MPLRFKRGGGLPPPYDPEEERRAEDAARRQRIYDSTDDSQQGPLERFAEGIFAPDAAARRKQLRASMDNEKTFERYGYGAFDDPEKIRRSKEVLAALHEDDSAPPEDTRSAYRKYGPLAMRAAGGVLPTLIGAASKIPVLGKFAGRVGIPAMLASGALGESAASVSELLTGDRRAIDETPRNVLARIGVASGLNTITGGLFSKAALPARMAGHAISGAAQSAGSVAAEDILGKSELPDAHELGQATRAGAIFGTALGGGGEAMIGAARLGNRLKARQRAADLRGGRPRPVERMPWEKGKGVDDVEFVPTDPEDMNRPFEEDAEAEAALTRRGKRGVDPRYELEAATQPAMSFDEPVSPSEFGPQTPDFAQMRAMDALSKRMKQVEENARLREHAESVATRDTTSRRGEPFDPRYPDETGTQGELALGEKQPLGELAAPGAEPPPQTLIDRATSPLMKRILELEHARRTADAAAAGREPTPQRGGEPFDPRYAQEGARPGELPLGEGRPVGDIAAPPSDASFETLRRRIADLEQQRRLREHAEGATEPVTQDRGAPFDERFADETAQQGALPLGPKQDVDTMAAPGAEPLLSDVRRETQKETSALRNLIENVRRRIDEQRAAAPQPGDPRQATLPGMLAEDRLAGWGSRRDTPESGLRVKDPDLLTPPPDDGAGPAAEAAPAPKAVEPKPPARPFMDVGDEVIVGKNRGRIVATGGKAGDPMMVEFKLEDGTTVRQEVNPKRAMRVMQAESTVVDSPEKLVAEQEKAEAGTEAERLAADLKKQAEDLRKGKRPQGTVDARQRPVTETTRGELAKRLRIVKQKAVTDPVTGGLNRSGFDGIRERRAQTVGQRSIFRGDLDNFKALNDELGHEAGDKALKVVHDAIKKQLRQGDLVSRVSGDEFAIDMELADPARAAAIIEDLEAAVSQALKDAGFGSVKGREVGISLGHGATEALADQAAMVRKKQRGVSKPREAGEQTNVARELRERRNRAGLARYQEQFKGNPEVFAAIEHIHRRNPRLASEVVMSTTPARPGKRAEFVPYAEPQGGRRGEMRFGKGEGDLIEAVEHEMAHYTDLRKMGPEEFAKRAAEEDKLPYDAQAMEQKAHRVHRARTAIREAERTAGRELTGQERAAVIQRVNKESNDLGRMYDRMTPEERAAAAAMPEGQTAARDDAHTITEADLATPEATTPEGELPPAVEWRPGDKPAEQPAGPVRDHAAKIAELKKEIAHYQAEADNPKHHPQRRAMAREDLQQLQDELGKVEREAERVAKGEQPKPFEKIKEFKQAVEDESGARPLPGKGTVPREVQIQSAMDGKDWTRAVGYMENWQLETELFSDNPQLRSAAEAEVHRRIDGGNKEWGEKLPGLLEERAKVDRGEGPLGEAGALKKKPEAEAEKAAETKAEAADDADATAEEILKGKTPEELAEATATRALKDLDDDEVEALMDHIREMDNGWMSRKMGRAWRDELLDAQERVRAEWGRRVYEKSVRDAKADIASGKRIVMPEKEWRDAAAASHDINRKNPFPRAKKTIDINGQPHVNMGGMGMGVGYHEGELWRVVPEAEWKGEPGRTYDEQVERWNRREGGRNWHDDPRNERVPDLTMEERGDHTGQKVMVRGKPYIIVERGPTVATAEVPPRAGWHDDAYSKEHEAVRGEKVKLPTGPTDVPLGKGPWYKHAPLDIAVQDLVAELKKGDAETAKLQEMLAKTKPGSKKHTMLQEELAEVPARRQERIDHLRESFGDAADEALAKALGKATEPKTALGKKLLKPKAAEPAPGELTKPEKGPLAEQAKTVKLKALANLSKEGERYAGQVWQEAAPGIAKELREAHYVLKSLRESMDRNAAKPKPPPRGDLEFMAREVQSKIDEIDAIEKGVRDAWGDPAIKTLHEAIGDVKAKADWELLKRQTGAYVKVPEPTTKLGAKLLTKKEPAATKTMGAKGSNYADEALEDVAPRLGKEQQDRITRLLDLKQALARGGGRKKMGTRERQAALDEIENLRDSIDDTTEQVRDAWGDEGVKAMQRAMDKHAGRPSEPEARTIVMTEAEAAAEAAAERARKAKPPASEAEIQRQIRERKGAKGSSYEGQVLGDVLPVMAAIQRDRVKEILDIKASLRTKMPAARKASLEAELAHLEKTHAAAVEEFEKAFGEHGVMGLTQEDLAHEMGKAAKPKRTLAHPDSKYDGEALEDVLPQVVEEQNGRIDAILKIQDELARKRGKGAYAPTGRLEKELADLQAMNKHTRMEIQDAWGDAGVKAFDDALDDHPDITGRPAPKATTLPQRDPKAVLREKAQQIVGDFSSGRNRDLSGYSDEELKEAIRHVEASPSGDYPDLRAAVAKKLGLVDDAHPPEPSKTDTAIENVVKAEGELDDADVEHLDKRATRGVKATDRKIAAVKESTPEVTAPEPTEMPVNTEPEKTEGDGDRIFKFVFRGTGRVRTYVAKNLAAAKAKFDKKFKRSDIESVTEITPEERTGVTATAKMFRSKSRTMTVTTQRPVPKPGEAPAAPAAPAKKGWLTKLRELVSGPEQAPMQSHEEWLKGAKEKEKELFAAIRTMGEELGETKNEILRTLVADLEKIGDEASLKDAAKIRLTSPEAFAAKAEAPAAPAATETTTKEIPRPGAKTIEHFKTLMRQGVKKIHAEPGDEGMFSAENVEQFRGLREEMKADIEREVRNAQRYMDSGDFDTAGRIMASAVERRLRYFLEDAEEKGFFGDETGSVDPRTAWLMGRMAAGALYGGAQEPEDPLAGAAKYAGLAAALGSSQARQLAGRLAKGGKATWKEAFADMRKPSRTELKVRAKRDPKHDLTAIEHMSTPEAAVPDWFARIVPSMEQFDDALRKKAGQKILPEERRKLRNRFFTKHANELKAAAVAARQAGQPNRATYLRMLAKQLLDEPTVLERFLSGATGHRMSGQRIASEITQHIYRLGTGANWSAGFINRVAQPYLALAAMPLRYLRKGKAYVRTPQGKALVDHLKLARPTDAPEGSYSRRLEKLDDFLQWPLRYGDIRNREDVFAGAYLFAKESGRTHDASLRYAAETMRATQAMPGELGNPPMLRELGPLRPFMKYPIVWAELVKTVLEKPWDDAGKRRFLGAMLGTYVVGEYAGLDMKSILFPRFQVSAQALTGISDAAAHLSRTADHPLGEDLGALLVPVQLRKTKEFFQQLGDSKDGILTKSDERGVVSKRTAGEGLLNTLLGFRTQRQRKEQEARSRFFERATQEGRAASFESRAARRRAAAAYDAGDMATVRRELQGLPPNTIAQFYRTRNRDSVERRRMQLSPRLRRRLADLAAEVRAEGVQPQ